MKPDLGTFFSIAIERTNANFTVYKHLMMVANGPKHIAKSSILFYRHFEDIIYWT
jgi:hypothetical protein